MNSEFIADSPIVASTDFENWLINSLGFTKGNPFAKVEADQERDLLPEFFVHVDGYEHMRSNKSIVAFAPRGGGKSALRIQLASGEAPLSPHSQILIVEYTNFDHLVKLYRQGQHPTIDDHIPFLLRTGLNALWQTFLPVRLASLPSDWRIRLERASKLPNYVRLHFARLLREYCPSLILPEKLCQSCITLLKEYGVKVDNLSFRDCSQAAARRNLAIWLSEQKLEYYNFLEFIADINDARDVSFDSAVTATEKVQDFRNFCLEAGFTDIHFLIDRLDESMETVNDISAQCKIIKPLISHLPLNEMPNVAFKYFLSKETRDELLTKESIRKDRIKDYAITITWTPEMLTQMLYERIKVYSDYTVHSLAAIFVSQMVSERTQSQQETSNHQSIRKTVKKVNPSKTFEDSLVPDIEKEIVQMAQNSPRRLLLIGGMLLDTHHKRVGPKGLLEWEDWVLTKSEVIQKMPLKLQINLVQPLVSVADTTVKLTKQEHSILQTLAINDGSCTREKLIDDVWQPEDGGVSEAALDQAISRLREKLKKSGIMSEHLHTDRGKGFILSNYEIE